jgi:hypothetical protein
MATGIQVDPSQVQSINVDPSEVQAIPGGQKLSWLDQVGQVFKGVRDNLAQTGQGIVDLGSAVGNAAMGHPGELGQLVKNAGAAQDAVRLAAEDAFKKGDYLNGIRHVLGYALPLVGPAIDALGNEAGSGQPGALAHAVGGSLALGSQLAAPGVLAEATPAAVGMVERVPSLTEVNPRVAAAKLYPGPANAPLISRAGEAFEDLKQFGGQTPETVLGNPKVGVENLAPTRLSGLEQSNIDTAIKNMQQQGLEPWMQRARDNGWTVPGNVIVQARVDAIPQMLWDESPDEARSLVAEAQRAYGGRQLTVDQARNLLVEKNKGSAPFQRQSTARQGTSEVGTTPSAIESADAAAIRTALYKTLDPENDGAGPAEIQRRTGNLIKLGNANEGQFSTIMAEKPATPAGALVQPVRNALSAVTQGKPTALLRNATHPFRGPSDAMITELYRQAGPAKALPLPPPSEPSQLVSATRIAGLLPAAEAETSTAPTVVTLRSGAPGPNIISRDQLGDFAKANDMTPAAAETRLLEEGYKVQ